MFINDQTINKFDRGNNNYGIKVRCYNGALSYLIIK